MNEVKQNEARSGKQNEWRKKKNQQQETVDNIQSYKKFWTDKSDWASHTYMLMDKIDLQPMNAER